MRLFVKANIVLKEYKFKLVKLSIWAVCFNFQYLLFIKMLVAMDAI